VRSRAFWRDSFEFWVLSFGFCVALGGARVSNPPRLGCIVRKTQNPKPKTRICCNAERNTVIETPLFPANKFAY
jgi:hypothetical protein